MTEAQPPTSRQEVSAAPDMAAKPATWWEEEIARAPRDPRFAQHHVPIGDRPMLHFCLKSTWRREGQTRYQLTAADLVGDAAVNPGKKVVDGEGLRRLAASLSQCNASLAALETGFWQQLGEAYHEQVRRGDYLEIPQGEDMEAYKVAYRAAITALEARVGKLDRDHFRMSTGLPNPLRNVVFYATAQNSPAVFATFAEILRVQDRARMIAKDFVAGL